MGKSNKDKSTSTKPPLETGASKPMPIGRGLAETAWRVALPFLVFSLGGIWLDETLEASPLFTIIGLLLALGGVAVTVYRFVDKNYPGTFGGKK